ncbi:MAG: MOSC domain-containing protein [Solirubrobacteraceae bacterium]
MAITVKGLATTAVKGTRLRAVESILLDGEGARGNRCFYVIDGRGRMVNGKPLGGLQTIVSDYDADSGELALTFASGEAVRGPVAYGDPIETRFFSEPRQARELVGPWSEALSAALGRPLRLVQDGTPAVDRGREGAVSLISRGSLARLAQVAEVDSIDVRRFRMLIEIDGVEAHAEDAWVRRQVRVGAALLSFAGHVGRCLITTRNPDSGVVDSETLDALISYRRELASTEPIPFGIYGAVLEGGAISVGDAVEVL